ncbi:5-oxoprolinase subunit PxpB [Heliorestis acidaminivorans]|uniref:5-oxoprolinase subunit PxpB n=2 Tax=Heliorestis acidaminivorans TaxID=553427 RepID=A0A6I0F196_9FIRM|nr:5-oxoprolinase subunit PxpB [Heliorestis acidaminivorans]
MGDSAWVVQWTEKISPQINREVQKAGEKIKKLNPPWLIEVVPTFASLTVYYDFLEVDSEHVKVFLEEQIKNLGKSQIKERQEWIIPVCYGGLYGPELKNISREKKLTVEEVIELHSQKLYTVYMLGFIPGFCYLGDVDDAIASPRLAVPRTTVPAGSVGIAGKQTGVYPLKAPGGWQIIGQTPVELYNPEKKDPVSIKAGDLVRFQAISEEDFIKMLKDKSGPYKVSKKNDN